MRRRAALIAVSLLSMTLVGAAASPKPGGTTPKPGGTTPKAGGAPAKPGGAAKVAPITDANVAERVLSARSKADQEALYDYYKAKAAAEEPRIAHFDQLFRAYMQMKGRWAEPMQRHARALLKAARMSKQRYELLALAHRNLAWEDY
jgi:hypothetical protein